MITQAFVVDVARAVAGAGSTTQQLERLRAAPVSAFVEEAKRRGKDITEQAAVNGRDGLIGALEVEQAIARHKRIDDKPVQLSMF